MFTEVHRALALCRAASDALTEIEKAARRSRKIRHSRIIIGILCVAAAPAAGGTDKSGGTRLIRRRNGIDCLRFVDPHNQSASIVNAADPKA